MCGIAGYAGPEVIEDARVEDTLALMGRRGPDHAAATRHAGPAGTCVTLLHSRLDIIDLDARANQPFQEDAHTLVYNGELYNYLELREALEARGERFRTESDTEVLLRVIRRDGWSALDRCEGMWAFAHYDEDAGVLHLCRDRFGEKPLWLARRDGGLFFASEVKFLFSLMGRRGEVDLDHVRRFLVNGYKALYKTPTTFFHGVEELPPGALLRLDASGTSRTRYWTPHPDQDPEMSREEAVAGVRERLIRAVELRLRADVPLAFCMSGGVDSNSLIAIARRVFDYDVHGFTIVNEDERYAEQDIVDEVVDDLSLRHTSIPVETADFLPRLRELVRQHDAPVYTISYFAHWLLMKSIAEHGYRISVSGTAADELFTGYYDHHLAYLREIRGDAALLERSEAAWREHIGPVVRNPLLQNPRGFIEDPGMRDHIYLHQERFAEYLTEPWLEAFAEEEYSGDLLRNRMLNELFHEAVPVILHEDDLNAMYYSIENRSPFLDRDLFEFAYRIPTRHLMRDALTKVVLRDAMRGIVPDVVLDSRRKVGFNAPIFSFLDRKDPGVREAVLQDGPVWEVVRRDAVEELLDRESLANSESKFLFYFLSSKLFLEEHA